MSDIEHLKVVWLFIHDHIFSNNHTQETVDF